MNSYLNFVKGQMERDKQIEDLKIKVGELRLWIFGLVFVIISMIGIVLNNIPGCFK